MITTTGIDSWEQVEEIVPEGWLRDYMKVARVTRFPLSFHILCGLFALTTVVGRRCRLQMPGYNLYPPIWIMLLGTSGVGKGVSMHLPYEVIKGAMGLVDEFILHRPDTFTRRGIVAECRRVIQDHNVNHLEGAILLDEGSSVFTSRTGTETIMQFLIKAGELDNITDFTGYLGAQQLTGFTLGFAISSTIDLLRESVNASVFTGGFMHRFFIAHELLRPRTYDLEGNPNKDDIQDLAQRARLIRDGAPPAAALDEDAARLLKRMAMRAEESSYTSSALAGFWNRLAGLVAKVGLGLSISRGSSTVTGDDVARAERLVRGHLYPPIAELVEELSHNQLRRRLFTVADDLYFCGERGMELMQFKRRLPSTNKAQMGVFFDFMLEIELVYQGTIDGVEWVWRLPEWVRHT